MDNFDVLLIGVFISFIFIFIELLVSHSTQKKDTNPGNWLIACVVVLIIALCLCILGCYFDWDSDILDYIGSRIPICGEPEPTESSTETPEPPPTPAPTIPMPEVGEIITFGTYEQDNDLINGQEPIEWIVLDVREDTIFVISKYALDCQPYHDGYTGVTWSSSYIRKWLNGTFMDTAFTSQEQEQIPIADVVAHPNPQYKTTPGFDTEDQIFLLSIAEAEHYFTSNSTRGCMATDYAIAQGGFVNLETGGCWWWLRTPGDSSRDASSINSDGSIDCDDGSVNSDKGSIRPAMWLRWR